MMSMIILIYHCLDESTLSNYCIKDINKQNLYRTFSETALKCIIKCVSKITKRASGERYRKEIMEKL